MVAALVLPDIATLTPRGVLDFSAFHEGQRRAFWSEARFTLVLAGTQGGKTCVGPPWLVKQMTERGPGDYMIVAPTFPLMEKKVIPEFRRLFVECMDLGDYKLSPLRHFLLSPAGERRLWGGRQTTPTRVYFGYGEDPESLESATIKAAWVDEGGQRKFKRESWDALLRRLSIEQGPVLLTTTPYQLGWLSELHEKANDPASSVVVINFPSIANPRFPHEEWERAKRDLPGWKFRMFYEGRFERPAGLIYDCFEERRHLIPSFVVPADWPRFLGLDFGGVHTAAIGLARELAEGEPTGRYVAYREYLAGGRTAKQHAAHLLAGAPRSPQAVGGSKSEGQWRREFAEGGLGIAEPPISDVEVGIQRVYGMLARDELVIMDHLAGLIDEMRSYSRVLDERGEPTEAIADKETYHRLDALRYVCAWLKRGGLTWA